MHVPRIKAKTVVLYLSEPSNPARILTEIIKYFNIKQNPMDGPKRKDALPRKQFYPLITLSTHANMDKQLDNTIGLRKKLWSEMNEKALL